MKNEQEILLQLQRIFSSIMPSYTQDYWREETELFFFFPEFDSIAIVTLIGEIEECFDIELEDDDITAENFETVGSVTQLLLTS